MSISSIQTISSVNTEVMRQVDTLLPITGNIPEEEAGTYIAFLMYDAISYDYGDTIQKKQQVLNRSFRIVE